MSTLETTLASLDALLTWGPNWNSYHALAPDPLAVVHAKEWITDLYQCVQKWRLSWIAPNVTADGEGGVVFECWQESKAQTKHKLTIYIDAEPCITILQISTIGTRQDITDTSLSKASDCYRIWKWFVEAES